MEIIKTLKFKIPNTDNLLLGEQLNDKKWNIYIVNHDETLKLIAKENVTSKVFALFTNVILNESFPYEKISH